MKKLILSLFLCCLFLVIAVTVNQAWARYASHGLSFELTKQKDKVVFVKEEADDFKKESQSSIVDLTEKIGIVWRARFDYPWQGQAVADRSLFEEGLDWSWESQENKLVGTAEIASCPVGLEYELQGNELKAKIYFTNTTEHPVENLRYRLILQYPPGFDLRKDQSVLSNFRQQIELKKGSSVKQAVLKQIYQGTSESALEYSLEVGTVNSQEKSEAEVSILVKD